MKSFRENFSVIMQNQANYPIKVLENIVLKNKLEDLDINKINESLKNGLIYDKVISHNKGIFALVSKMFDNDRLAFSGGENQKLNMSRFFSKDSPILVLDEYEKWIDHDSNRIILEHIMNFSKNKTLIIVTHDKNILSMMDKVIVLKNGVIQTNCNKLKMKAEF